MNTKKEYKPRFLSWCSSLKEEIDELKILIQQKPDDIELLKNELAQLLNDKKREVKK